MYPPEPSEPPTWDRQDDLSRPDPAAYARANVPDFNATDALHATHPIGDAASVPLYPPNVSAPPPPPANGSSPTFFPMLYPTQPHANRVATFTSSALGVIIGMVVALLLIACLGLFAWQHGSFQQFFGGSASHPSASATPTLVLGGIAATKTPVVRVTTTPGVLVTVTPGPQPTANPTTTPFSGLTPTPLATVTPGPSPTPSPTATVAPTATMAPTPTFTPVPLTVAITCLSAQDHQSATLCVHTGANAALTISVVDCDGPVDNGAPTSGTADGSGNYMKMWRPRKPGMGCRSAKVTVTATLNGQQATTSGTLTLM